MPQKPLHDMQHPAGFQAIGFYKSTLDLQPTSTTWFAGRMGEEESGGTARGHCARALALLESVVVVALGGTLLSLRRSLDAATARLQ